MLPSRVLFIFALISINFISSKNLNTACINLSNLPSEKQVVQYKTLLIPDGYSTPLRLSKEKLGHRTWEILHSIAADYPLKPTSRDKEEVVLFLKSLSKLYPCNLCGAHFRQMLKKHPIQNKSRKSFSKYLCKLHNEVNLRLKKELFNCDSIVRFYRNKNNDGIKLPRAYLGRISWSLLHSIAAAYPKENAKEKHKKYLKKFLYSFAYLYPYSSHGSFLYELIKNKKIQSSTREDVVFYLCRIHNRVNAFLKKRIFDCEEAFNIWGGKCGCSAK